jgi:signal transduction histidine kinase/CheY-like chemotaxis protein
MGIFYAVFALIGVMTINFLHINRIINSQVDYNVFNKSLNTWISTLVGFIIIILFIIYAVGKFYNYYIETISDLKNNTRQLEESFKQLEIKENELELQNKELINLNHQLQIEKEKAQESDRLKTAFLQNVSHEIRTPMNAIMGFSKLLSKNYNNKPKLEKFSVIINQRCKDLLDIINDLLDIAKIESGQLTFKMEECNLKELFDELIAFYTEYQKRIGKQHIQLNLQDLSTLTNHTIISDKVKLKQIFINLINNAFKFTNIGKIEGACKIDDHDKLIFYVSDTGIGIPDEKQQLVFDRFAQLSPGEDRLVSGTGLGLSIVKGLVELMGGEIWLESKIGVGTTFYFSLPYIQTKIEVESNRTELVGKFQEIVLQNKTILIVEDDNYNAEYLKEILTYTQLNVLLARNGKEAVDIAIKQPVDLILMDVNLPDFNGYEAITQIKKLKPDIKVIVQTAYASVDEKQKAMGFGSNNYISKPIDQELLLSLISNHLK